MTMEEVAQQYAAEHGLELHERLRVPQRSPQLAANIALVQQGEVAYAVVGPIAGGRQGMLYLCTGGRAMGPAEAQFEIPGLGGALDGLWVRRSGRSVWTRIKLPAGYTELRFDDAAFDGNYRVAVREASSEAAARRLLDREFTAWHVEHAMQGNKLSQAGSFELAGERLFMRGPNGFRDREGLEAFGNAAAGLADRVAAFVARGV